MHRVSVAAACAAMLFALSTAVAPAGTPIRGTVVKGGRTVTVGLGPENHRVIVTIQDGTGGTNPLPTSYAYNPVDGSINQLPTPAENTNPTTGIGVVVKGPENCQCPPPQTRTVPLDNGVGSLSPLMPAAGNYNIVVTVQANAINTKGTGTTRMAATGSASATTTASLPKQTMLLTFHVVVDAKGNMTMDPRMRPSVTAAPSREPTQ